MMKSCFLRILFPVVFCLGFLNPASAQSTFWKPVKGNELKGKSQQYLLPTQAAYVEMDVDALRKQLQSAPSEGLQPLETYGLRLDLPMPDGSTQTFALARYSMLPDRLAAQFPGIVTCIGKGIQDPTAQVFLDVTYQGFHAQILRNGQSVYIDPVFHNETVYHQVYDRRNLRKSQAMKFACGVDQKEFELQETQDRDKNGPNPSVQFVTGTTRREYRIAMAVTQEYTTFHGGTVSLAMSAISTTLNRINGVYNRDVTIRFNLIANNNMLVYTAEPDPYTNGNTGNMNAENQSNLDNIIGSGNYDIGHVMGTGSGGMVQGRTCNNSNKAYGSTARWTPMGDPFDIDYVAHEIGHQMDAPHTWNGTIGSCSPGQYIAGSAVEPGSGITIMGYAGICGTDDLAPNSIDHFHRSSQTSILNFVTTGSGNSCGTAFSTANTPPTATVLVSSGLTIPRSTPYELRGSGTDANGDALTYCWEQTDLGAAGPPTNSARTDGPITRSFSPATSGTRSVPELTDLLNNTTTKGNLLGTVTRTMNFALTVRDNRPNGGGARDVAYSFNITSLAGPFVVTAPNGFQTVSKSSPLPVTWDVANTHLAPVNCANVAIKLSVDGGLTYPHTLIASTPNDGSQSVTLPNVTTSTARIRVEGVGNIFFDISNSNFAIADYCSANAICSDVDFGNHNIVRVMFNTLNNISSCSANGYGQFPATTTVNSGSTHTLSVTPGTGVNDHGVAAWIDYNNDGDFNDPNEMVMSVGPGSGVRTGSVTIPGHAQFQGARRLRVRIGYQHTFTSGQACFGLGFGETEDYTITIGGYCFQPTICSDVDFGNHQITRVRFSNIDNSSTCSPQGYINYAGIVGTGMVESGKTYAIQINKTTAFAEGVGVWMDLNKDQDFNDFGEFMYQGLPNTNALVTANIRIPSVVGVVLMRVRVGFDATYAAGDACSGSGFGETEDYQLLVSGYCFSTAICSDIDFGNHYINTFNFSGIQNTGSGCGNSGYTYSPETEHLAVVGLGQSYSGNLVVAPGFEHGNAIWIDFDDDNYFGDAGERVAFTSGSSMANNNWLFGISIPNDPAILGMHRMRVRTGYNTDFLPDGACALVGFGETEDYMIDIRLEVTLSPISGSACTGASRVMFFNTFGTFPAGNTFTVQLSDKTGSFGNPLQIGTGTTSPILCSFPDSLTAGSGYKIRIVSSQPVGITSVLNNVSVQKSPLITGMNPTSGPPGTVVTFTGTNLQSVGSLFFGQFPGTNLQVAANGQSCTVVVPDGATSGPVFTTGGCSVQGPFFSVVNTVAAVVISPGTGTYADPQSVTLSTTTSGAQIYYTTSGNLPVIGTSFTRLYSGPIPVLQTTTIRAIGVKSGFTNSSVSVAYLTITSPGIVATPVIAPGTGSYAGSQTVSITTTTPGSTLYFTTNGNVPRIDIPNSYTMLYTGPFLVNATTTIRAMGVKAGILNSAVALATLTITTVTPTAATPVITPGTGSYAGPQTVSISTSTSGAAIYYTTNGNVPRLDVPNSFTRLYSGPFLVTGSTTVRALATGSGFLNSAVATAYLTLTPGRLAVDASDEAETWDEIRIWPNPSSGIFYLQTDTSCPTRMEVFSSDGRRIRTDENLKDRVEVQVDLTQEPAGIYMLRLVEKEGTKSYRLRKQ